MKILPISPIGAKSYLLFDTMVEEFRLNGHTFVKWPAQADIAFLDAHVGAAPYDVEVMQSVHLRGIPVVVFDQFEYCNPPPKTREWKPGGNVIDLSGTSLGSWLAFLNGSHQIKLWFMKRKASHYIDYPEYVVPMGNVQYPDHDFPPVSKDELMARPNDICFVGTECEWRRNIMDDLISCGLFKVDCEFITERYPHDVWLDRQRQAKMFVSGDGPGCVSDRPMQQCTIAPMIKLRNYHEIPVPWVHGHDCVEAANEFGKMDDGDAAMLRGVLDDPDKLHEIYLNGIAHVHQNCSNGARSIYVLDQLRKFGLL